MKDAPIIPASWFYRDDSEKIKLNWFLYEFACKFFEHIGINRTKRIADWKARHSDGQIAEFCAYYSKRMRRSIAEQIETGAKTIKVYDEYLADYCHANTRRENEAISKIGGAAWEELLDRCEACTCNCLRECSGRCEFFDEIEAGGS